MDFPDSTYFCWKSPWPFCIKVAVFRCYSAPFFLSRHEESWTSWHKLYYFKNFWRKSLTALICKIYIIYEVNYDDYKDKLHDHVISHTAIKLFIRMYAMWIRLSCWFRMSCKSIPWKWNILKFIHKSPPV